jgi:hypothetical protein
MAESSTQYALGPPNPLFEDKHVPMSHRPTHGRTQDTPSNVRTAGRCSSRLSRGVRFDQGGQALTPVTRTPGPFTEQKLKESLKGMHH